jgi:hypothetical protein
MKEDLYTHVLKGLQNAIERSTALALAEKTNIQPSTIGRWATRARGVKTLIPFFKLLEAVNAKVVFPEDVDADFSQDLAEKTEEIRRLRQELEKKAEEKFILEGRLRAYKEMMEEYRERLEAKENPAGAGRRSER